MRIESRVHRLLIYKSFLHVLQNSYAGFGQMCILHNRESYRRGLETPKESTIYIVYTVFGVLSFLSEFNYKHYFSEGNLSFRTRL